MNLKDIENLARELSKDVKTQQDLSVLTSHFLKTIIESSLEAEMEDHLGYSKNQKSSSTNSRNGSIKKTLKTEKGELEISAPRDRDSSFKPKLVPKRVTKLEGIENAVLHLYAKGMTTRDIKDSVKELYYGVDISHELVSNITESVQEEVLLWQNRFLDSVYPIIFLDCIVIKVRQDNQVINKAIYIALGLNCEGYKEVLGLWISENEGSKFWLGVLTDLQNRGVKDVFIFCVDGLKGFPEAIKAAYPKSKIQLCIVHMVRNSMRYVASKDMKKVAASLKKVYKAQNEKMASKALDEFATEWSDKYPQIERSWRNNWDNIITMFNHPKEIRKVMYTTNAIESLNSVIRKSIRNRKIFPSDKSAFKIIYLAIKNASDKWTMPIREWKPAMNRFAIDYDERFIVK